VLIKSREMAGRTQILPWWLEGRRGKDDRKQKTFGPVDPSPLLQVFSIYLPPYPTF
jgi:hypothetical protein